MKLDHENQLPFWLALFVAVSVVSLTPAARADATYSTAGAEGDEVTVIQMTVTPAAEPVPALKHRLVARDIELEAGNAAPYYYRAILETKTAIKQLLTKYGDEFDRWYDTGTDAPTIAELPVDKLREADGTAFDGAIGEQLADANLRRDCDWQLGVEEERGPEVFSFMLSEFNQGRDLARLLALRTRLAIAEERYDDAVNAMQWNYRLGRDVAQPPFLVCGLIGIAIGGMANGTAIDLIAAPDSPNLYWALSELPEPLVDMRAAARLELGFGPRIFPLIHHAETTERSDQEWNRLYTQAFRDLSMVGGGGMPVLNETGAGFAATGMALVGYSHAKDELIAQGMDRQRVEAMAVGQVMTVYTQRNYQSFADDFEKLWYVPYWEMHKRFRAIDRRLEQAHAFHGGRDREVLPIVAMLLPAMHAARSAQVRLERDVAALRVIEALRMYAASHAGGLPSTLTEITEVPVPLNPATGKSFIYRLDGRTAILELPASEGFPSYNRRFEITIAQD